MPTINSTGSPGSVPVGPASHQPPGYNVPGLAANISSTIEAIQASNAWNDARAEAYDKLQNAPDGSFVRIRMNYQTLGNREFSITNFQDASVSNSTQNLDQLTGPELTAPRLPGEYSVDTIVYKDDNMTPWLPEGVGGLSYYHDF